MSDNLPIMYSKPQEYAIRSAVVQELRIRIDYARLTDALKVMLLCYLNLDSWKESDVIEGIAKAYSLGEAWTRYESYNLLEGIVKVIPKTIEVKHQSVRMDTRDGWVQSVDR